MALLSQIKKTKYILNKFNYFNLNIPKYFSASIQKFLYDEKDPAPLFFNPEIQNHLKVLTRIDFDKVFRKRTPNQKYLHVPEYKFMTTEQLNNVLNDIKQKADDKLQMPPVVKVREPITEVLSKDSALTGLNDSKLVFTDISYGIEDSNRLIVTREPDGTLKKSDWDVRHRMNQLYFPKSGRSLSIPRLFQNEYLQNLLERKEYIFILDAACNQFEPDDELYQIVTSQTYLYINNSFDFELIRSTRHFGPFVFFLVWKNNVDNILLNLLETKHMNEINHLIQLYFNVHNFSLLKNQSLEQLLHTYVANSAKKDVLELALQKINSYKTAEEQAV